MDETISAAAAASSAFTGAKISTLTAGVIGAALSLRFLRREMSVVEVLTTIPSGAAMAVYGAPLAAWWFNILEQQVVIALGFFIGLFGLSLCAAAFEAIREAKPWQFVMGKWGGGNPSSGDKP